MPYKDKEKHKAFVRNAMHERHQRRNILLAQLKDKPCMDCGGRFPPECMDFDHIDGEKKFKAIGQLRSHSIERILEEIEKCELICSNCHRIRTKKRSMEKAARDRLRG